MKDNYPIIMYWLIIFAIGALVISCKDQSASKSSMHRGFVTVEHDGHTFITHYNRGRGSIVHHPDCQCKEAKDE